MRVSEKDLKKISVHPLFASIDRARLASVFEACGCEVREFDGGEVILSPESATRAAGILLVGRAIVTTPDPTRKTLLRYLGAGEPFGIANLFDSAPFISLIRAQSKCRVFFLTEDAARRLLEEEHAFLYAYLAFLSGRIRYLNRKIGYLTAGETERRLALYLASFGTDRVELGESISALSELLGVGRASLYRAFDRLIADGFLQKEGRVLHLPDREALLRAYQ